MTNDDSACLSAADLGCLADHDGGGPSATVATLGHLAVCAVCRERLASLRDDGAFLASVRASMREEASRTVDAPPIEVPGYVLLDEISRGGQALIQRARHETTGRIVALKIIAAASTRERARLEREAQLAARLRHPNIVTVYDTVALRGGGVAIVMEFVDGQPLDTWVQQVDGGHEEAVVRRARKVSALLAICGAVHHAHERGVIHRDLKPSNVVVDAFDEPRLVDFGIARPDHAAIGTAITRTGEFSGTLAYAAPEQLAGDGTDGGTPTDVYGLGGIIFESLVGRAPHARHGPIDELLRAIRFGNVEIPAKDSLGLRIDLDLATIMRRAMALEPARRYDSAAALGRDLDHWRNGRGIEARRESTMYVLSTLARRHRVPVIGAVIALTALVGFLFALAYLYRQATIARAAVADEAGRSAEQAFDATLDQSVLLAANGRLAGAEELVWHEALAPHTSAAVGVAPDDPRAMAILWALRQVSARSPCEASYIVDDKPIRRMLRIDDETLGVIAYPPALWELSLSDGRVTVHDDGRTAGAGTSFDLAVDPGRRRWAVVDEHRVVLKSLDDDQVIVERERTRDTALSHASFTASGLFVTVDKLGNGDAMDLESGVIAFAFSVPPQPAGVPVIAADGRTLVAVGSMPGDMRAVDLRDGRSARLPPTTGYGSIEIGAVPWPNGCVVFWFDGVRRWCPSDGTVTGVRSMRDPSAVFVPPSAGGDLCASLSAAGTVRLFNVSTGLTLRQFAGNPRPALPRLGAGVFLDHDRRLVTGGTGGVVRVWDLDETTWTTARNRHGASVGRLSFTPDGRVLRSFGRDGTLFRQRVGGTSSVDEQLIAIPSRSLTSGVAISPDGALAATHDWSPVQTINLRRSDDLTVLETWPTIASAGPLEFSPDGRQLAIGWHNDGIRIFDLKDGSYRDIRPDVPCRPRAMRYSPDGRSLLFSTVEGTLYFVSVDASVYTPAFANDVMVRSLAFSPDGTSFVTGENDGRISLWDTATCEKRDRRLAHGHWVSGVAWSPDGQLIASVSYAGEVAMWSAKGLRRLADLETDSTPLHTVLFSPGSTQLVTGDDLGTVRTWDLTRYDASIAQQVETWITLFERQGIALPNAPSMRAWAKATLEFKRMARPSR